MPQWYDISRSEDYKSLSPEEKAQAKSFFFQKNILPSFQSDPELNDGKVIQFAFDEFMSIPDDTGQGYITSMLGAAGRGFGEVVPGVVEGVGALTGIEPIQEAGQDIRAGLEYISPVNPIYAESVPVKLSQLGGQIGSVLATGGIGGAAGRALAAERIAAAGTQAARQAALTQAVQRGAQTALLGTAAAQGAAEGAQQAEQYGMTGPEAYLRTLAGAATEVGTELLPFGMAAETALAKRALASAPRTTGFVGSTLSEGGEEALAQIGSNIATQVLAPAGVETPGITEGALEAGLYGAAGGAMLGGVNALISTPPERQTQIQRDLEAEVGAIPKDTVPDQTNEQKLNAMNAGGTTVVDPNGKTAVIPPAPTPAPTPTVVKPAANPAIDVANKLNSVSSSNPDARQAAAAAQANIDKAKADADAKMAADEQAAKEAAIWVRDQLLSAPTPITTAPAPAPALASEPEPEPLAELPTPSPPTGQPTALPVGTVTPTTTPEDAIQEQITDAGVLRQEGPEMELQGVGEGNVQPEEVAGEGEVEAQEEVDRSVALPPPPEGVDSDIIDYILGNWSIESVGKKQRDKRRTTGEVEAFERLSQELLFPARNILFSPDRGRNLNRGNLDVIAQAAFERNLIPSPDANALTDEILKAYNARKSGKSPFAEMRQQEEAAEQRTLEFEKAARERTAPLTLMPARDLEIGDVVQVGDDNMRVTFEYDEDGYPTATILTGPKFGEQRVDPNKPFKAEKLDKTNRVQATSEFVSEAELEGAIPEPPPAEVSPQAPQPSPNLPALVAVRDNNATPEQVQSLVEQGLVERVGDQNIITEAGVAAMPEGEKPRLTSAQRRAEVEGMAAPVAEPSVTTPAKAATVKSTELRVGDEVSFKGNTYRVKKILSDGRVRAEFTNPEGIARIPKGSENITTLPRNVNFTRIEKQPSVTAPVAEPTAAETQTPDSVAVEPEAPTAQPPAAEPVTAQPPVKAAKPAKGSLAVSKLIPKSLTKSKIQPNHVIVGLVSFPDYREMGVEQIPYDGTAEDAQRVAGIVRQQIQREGISSSATIILASDENGKFKWVSSPNGKIDDINTPEGQYALGDVNAFTKARGKKAAEARAAGDTAKADAVIVEQIDAEIGRYDGPMDTRALDEVIEARALKSIGQSVKMVDDRMSSWDELIVQRKRNQQWSSNNAKNAIEKAITLLDAISDPAVRESQLQRINGIMDKVNSMNERFQKSLSGKVPKLQEVDIGLKSGDPISLKFTGEGKVGGVGYTTFIRAYDAGFQGGPRALVIYYRGSRSVPVSEIYDAQGVNQVFTAPTATTTEVTPEVTPAVTTPEAEAQQKKDEKEAKKLENESRASLARLIAGERGNPVFGNVTMDDGIEALRQLDEAGDLPNIFFTEITSTQEFLSKPENEQNFPDTWAALSAGGKAEGMEEKGTAFVFIDNVGVTNLDRKLATQFGTTPEVAAVRRVATHESIHKAISFLNESEQIALFRYLRELYSPEQLDVLAETYTNFANWRESKSSYLNLIEESLTRTIDSMESLPKDGILGEFIQWLKGIWRKITGKKGEPTLNDMKDVMRLIRNGLRNSTKARADRTISGGVVRYSAVTPQAPATDAEYLAAVEAGDSGNDNLNQLLRDASPDERQAVVDSWIKRNPKAAARMQRMVEGLAKEGGFTIGAFHGTPDGSFTEFKDSPRGLYFTSKQSLAEGYTYRRGAWLSPGKNPTIYRTKLRMQNPLRIDAGGARNNNIPFPGREYKRTVFGNLPAGAISVEEAARLAFEAGHDGIIIENVLDGVSMDDRTRSTVYVIPKKEQVKSADPVTRDDQGRIIPPSQRFQPTSPDIRFSLPTLVSESASAFSSGQQAARAISFTPRQLDVYMAVLGAFSTLRRKGKQSATMQELFDAANTLVSGITPNEFSETLQGLYNDNAALLNPGDSTFQVFNRDGELAGAVVLVAKDTSRASLIPPEEVKGITDKLTSDMDKAVTEGEQSPFEGLSFTGNVPKMHARVNFRNVEKAAEDFVNQMIRSRKEKGRTYIEALIDIADMVATDNFAKEYIGGAGMESQGLVLQAVPPPLNNKIYAAQMTNISEADRVRLEDAYRKVSLYYEGIGTVGGTLQGYRAWTATRGKYGWLLDSWKADALKTAEYAVNAQMGGSVSVKINQDLNDAVTGVGKAVADEVSGIVEEDAEMELLREGEAELDGKRRTTWERIKLLIRRLAFYAKADKMEAAPASRASLSQAEIDELNAILRMPKAERDKAKAKDLAELDALMAEFLGEDKPTDTPTERAKKGKRKDMVKAAEKIIFREGKDVEFRKTSIQEAVADLFNGADEYGKIVEEVGNALLARTKQAKGMTRGPTAIRQLVQSIKQTLLANLPPPKAPPSTNATLGKMLAMTFSQQIREARLYADAWSKGRTEVRSLLAETGLEGEALENELDAIMPPTPTLAYAPNAAKRAIALAMEQAGVTREELTDGRVNVSNEAKAKVMAAFDAAAAAANLSAEGWSTQGATGRQLAERALNEAVQQWIIQASNRVKISSIVAEQADNPVSIEEFAKKLSQFNLTPKQVKRYFDIAARAAVRRVEINNEKAKRIIYERGDIRPDVAEKDVDGDTVIEAFRDQVNSPTEEQAFLERLSKLRVAENVAKDLFNTAARERRDRQRTRVFDMIEGKNAIQKMLREIALARRGIEMPLRNPIPWTELLSKPAKSVDEYRQRVLDGILANPDMESVDNDVKERIADMFTDLWQEQVDKAVNRVIDNYTLQLDRAQRRQAGEALNKSRSKVIQHLNLGVLSNDAFIRILGEKFGIKMDMTKEERKHIESLLATLQDESLPKNKRNQASDDLASALMQYTKVGWSARLSLFWAMSVLAGWNTMLAIGMSFMNGANIILVRTPIGILSKMAQGDFKGALDVTFDSLNDMKRYLEAFPEAVDRAWGYITSGKVDLLEAEAAAPDRLFKSWDSLAKYRKVADQMVQDPKMLVRWMGTFMRMIGRIMTALDGFNTIVTKRGHLSMAVRLVAPDKEAFDRIIAKGSIEHYRQMLLASDPYFANMTPEKRRLLNSTAEAMMYQAMNEEGAKLENADFYASESAFTMDPSGLGGMIYGAIKKAEETSKSFAERNLAEKRLEAQGADRLSLENAKLAAAYITHFLAYNAVNYVGLRFARFAANKFNQGLSFIPFLGMTRFWEKSNSKLVDRQEAFTEMIYRNQAVGAVFAILGVMLIRALDEEPDDEKRGWFINGGLENVPTAQRRQLQEGGKLQYRLGVKINGRWLVFSYQNWPWSQLFSALGSTSDMIRFSPEKWREKGTSDILLSVAASGLTSTLDLPALQGLGTVLGRSISSSDPAEDFWTNIGAASANWVGGFIPKPLMDLDYILDSNRRKYTTIWEKTAGVVPFYRRYVGEDYYNILGDPIKRNALPGSREFLLGPTEPAYKILGALNSRDIWLTPANAEQRMVGKGRNRRRLTQQEADAYSLETGKAYKTMILRYGPRALKMSPERARAFLSDKADEVRDRVLMKVYRGYRSRPSLTESR